MSFSDAERLATPPEFEYEKIELPHNVRLTIRLENHGSVMDLPSQETLSQMITDSDAVLVESITEYDLNSPLGKIAKGDVKEYQRLKTLCSKSDAGSFAWLSAVISGAFNTRSAVANWDISVFDRPATKLIKGLDKLGLQNANARTEEEVLRLKPLQIAVFEQQRDRDQLVMERLAPTIGALSTSHSLFGKKLRSDGTDVIALYGTVHRSLVDGLAHKKNMEPGSNFEVRYHSESYLGVPEEELYARFLRGLELPDEVFIKRLAVSTISASLQLGGYLRVGHTPSKEIDKLSERIIQDRPYSEIYKIRSNLRVGKYDLLVSEDEDEPIHLVEKDRSSPFIKS